jgi:hypothetical protein
MEDWPSTPLAQDVRNVVDDLHHGLRQRGLVGDADALAHALKSASEAGVPEAEIERLATEQFRLLLSRSSRGHRRILRLARRKEIARGTDVKWLPPGSSP